MSTLSNIAERAVNTGWQVILGGTTGIDLFGANWKGLLTAAGVAALASIAKSAVATYYTGNPSLLKSVHEGEAILTSPVVAPVVQSAINKVEALPEVKKVEATVAPVVAPVVAQVVAAVEAP